MDTDHGGAIGASPEPAPGARGEFAARLGAAGARAIDEWAHMAGLCLELDRWLDNGKSGAAVGIVYEDGSDGAQKRVLKADQVTGGYDQAEYRRMRLAHTQSPDFARRRLAAPVHQPIRLGDGRWAILQEIAGASLVDLGVLTTLLDRARTGSEPRGEPGLARATAVILREILHEWTGRPNTRTRTAAQFVGVQLAERLSPGKPLHEMARSMTGRTIRVAGEPVELPNPFAFAEGRLPSAERPVRSLIGKAHGDLHTENILIPLRDGADPSGFRLIDLARYAPDAPLTRDVTHLGLYIAARALADLSDIQRNALIDLLLGIRSAATLLPGWLVEVLTTIGEVAEEWAGSLVDEWREQRILSLVACGLIFLGRRSTRPADREWFLRLAGRATALYQLGRSGEPNAQRAMDGALTAVRSLALVRGAQAAPVPALPKDGWVDALCRRLPQLRVAARERGLSDLIESLITRARVGGDGHADFVGLLRKLGEGDDEVRVAVPGLAGGHALFGEYYVCPTAKCPRTALRETAKGVPRCHLAEMGMRLREW